MQEPNNENRDEKIRIHESNSLHPRKEDLAHIEPGQVPINSDRADKRNAQQGKENEADQ